MKCRISFGLALATLWLAGCLPNRPEAGAPSLMDQFEMAVRRGDVQEADHVAGQILGRPDIKLNSFFRIHDLYASHGYPREAIATMKRVLRERPKLSASDRANLYRGIAADTFALGEIDAARRCYEDAMDLDENNPVILSDYAYFLAETNGNLNYARRLARQALLFAPSEPGFLDTLGWVSFKSGQHQLALDYFSQALAIDANNPELRLHAAMAFESVGKKQKAVEFYLTCLKPGSMYVRVGEIARERLRILDPGAYAKATRVSLPR